MSLIVPRQLMIPSKETRRQSPRDYLPARSSPRAQRIHGEKTTGGAQERKPQKSNQRSRASSTKKKEGNKSQNQGPVGIHGGRAAHRVVAGTANPASAVQGRSSTRRRAAHAPTDWHHASTQHAAPREERINARDGNPLRLH
jgi:hypothetical protein